MTVKTKAAKKKALTKKKVPTKKSAKSKSSDMKTKPTAASVAAFVAAVPNAQRRADAQAALKLMTKWTGLKPKMWGTSIIGFGTYHYKYDSGREGDMCMTGFSPRSSALVFYAMGGVPDDDPLFKKLGKHKRSKSCIYINKLSDVDLGALEAIIRQSLAYMRMTYKIAS